MLGAFRIAVWFVIASFVVGGCSDSEDVGPQDKSQDTDSSGQEGDTNDTGLDATSVLGNVDLTIGTGTFWKYGWDSYKSTSSGFGTSSSQSEDAGVVWVELGASTVVNDVTLYEILLSGDTMIGDNPITRWQFMGVAENRIYVSENGAQLVELFDAEDGEWPGSGFFTTFDSSTTYMGYQVTLNNDYISTDAIAISAGSSSDQCSYDRLTGQTFCDDVGSVNDQKIEYYSLSLGVLGYYRYFSYSELSYDWQYSSTEEIHIGLQGSSLRGDTIDKPVQITAITPASGTYTGAQTISVATIPANAAIRYTTDGTEPSSSNGIEVVGTGEKTFSLAFNTPDLRVIAYAPGMSDSAIEQRNYEIVTTIDFAEDDDGWLQVYINDPDQYGWYYYDIQPEYISDNLTSTVTEIELSKLSGADSYGAGMIFGATNTAAESFFYFLISPNGYYNLYHWDDVDGDVEVIPWTQSTFINTGMNQVNTLRVDTAYTPAGQNSISLYINGTVVNSVNASQTLGAYSGFIMFIGTEEYEDFPSVPVDVRFRMQSPVIVP